MFFRCSCLGYCFSMTLAQYRGDTEKAFRGFSFTSVQHTLVKW